MLLALPEASLSFITGYLSIRDACSLRRLCRNFRLLRFAMVKLHFTEVRQFEQAMQACVARSLRALEAHAEIKDDDLLHLRDMTGLVHLDLSWCSQITQASFEHVALLTTLEKLDLGGIEVTDAGLAALSPLSELKFLNLRTCDSPPNTSFSVLTAFENLETLVLSTNKVLNDQVLAVVGELRTLTHLDMNCCPRVTRVGVAHLATLTKLTFLDLGACRSFASKDLAELATFTQLETLNLRRCALVTGTSKLALLPNLKVVNLEQTGIVDEGLAHFNLSLENLNISSCGVSDAGLAHLSCLTNLCKLQMVSCWFSDAGLEHLTPLANLWYLNLSWCNQITDAGLNHVSTMKSLVELHLQGLRGVTCVGVAHLERLLNLKHLDLRGCSQVGKKSIMRALKRVKLAYLDVRDCGVTKECAAQLSKGHEVVMS